VVIRKSGKVSSVIYTSKKPIAKISTLAVHLKNTATEVKIKKETDLKPILATELLKSLHCKEDGECTGLLKFLKSELNLSKNDEIIDFDLCFGDFTKP